MLNVKAVNRLMNSCDRSVGHQTKALSVCDFLFCGDKRSSSRCCGVADLAHEDDAPRRMLQDEDQERSVQDHGVGQAHGHDLNGGGGRCLCSRLVHAQHGLVGNLQRGREEAGSV